MENLITRAPIAPGEQAPDFSLPTLHREGTVSLADFRGKSPVLLVIMRGLYCPFCRRHLGQLVSTTEQLAAAGVELLAVVATPVSRAKTYLKFRPARFALAADPDLETHRAFGLPQLPRTPENQVAIEMAPINPFGDLPEPRPLIELAHELDRVDPYEFTAADQAPYDREQYIYTGQFLIDIDGIVRWSNIEGMKEGHAGLGKFPSDEEILAAVQNLP